MSIRNRFFVSAALLASVTVAQPALAQAPAAAAQTQMTVGASVSDTAGGAVGTITAVEDGFVTLRTDRHEVRLPVTSFTQVEDGYIMAMTQAQVNAAVEQSLAEAQAMITVGALVRGAEGGVIGTIDALDDQFVTLKMGERLVKLPRNAVGAGATGPVIGMTAAELEAAASAAAPAVSATAEVDAAVD